MVSFNLNDTDSDVSEEKPKSAMQKAKEPFSTV